ncbi:hypothetical protein TeGR_g12869 [Tetraparma gracilis]|uniref:Uncharacterized protein n=1 Tax=Tetraparma gracilis TaxID=2962635 RepID=A0ABQ6M410_9STRA|nr:hypothetical protein TeGR_g12869 [Tetraparma gracilis]
MCKRPDKWLQRTSKEVGDNIQKTAKEIGDNLQNILRPKAKLKAKKEGRDEGGEGEEDQEDAAPDAPAPDDAALDAAARELSFEQMRRFVEVAEPVLAHVEALIEELNMNDPTRV